MKDVFALYIIEDVQKNEAPVNRLLRDAIDSRRLLYAISGICQYLIPFF